MKLYKEESVSSFEFWSGAKDTAKYLTEEELNIIENMLEDIYPDGMSETLSSFSQLCFRNGRK